MYMWAMPLNMWLTATDSINMFLDVYLISEIANNLKHAVENCVLPVSTYRQSDF